jgi:hypothetical protein
MTLQFTETVDEVALKTALAQVLGIPEALISFQTPTTRRLLAQTASEIVVVIAAPTLDSLQNIQEVESNVEFAGDVTTKMVEVVEQTAQAAFDAGSISAEEKAQTVAQASAVVPPVVADVILDIDEDTYRQRFNINITDFPTKNPTPFPTPSPTAYPTPQPTKAPTPPEGLEYFEKSTQTCADLALYITTEAKCRDAATTLGLPFAGVAGTEWHSGCLFHHGQVYYSPHEAGSRQDPTHEYICIKQRQWVAGCIVQDNSVWFSPYTSPQYNVEQTNHGYICNADYS